VAQPLDISALSDFRSLSAPTLYHPDFVVILIV
jgi:hypothetical protein